MLVPDAELIFDYISSYSKQARELISADKKRFLSYVKAEMNADGYMYIHKSTGIAICKKTPQ